MMWYKVGAADEPPGKSGIAHFLEHLMFKGTANRAPGEFSEIVARNGGKENAFTSQDYTGYYQIVSKDKLGLMMELEADRMMGLVLNQESINIERQVVIEERRTRVETSPQAKLNEQVMAATYSNHPYRLPVIGWKHEIEALQLDDIIGFYKKWYAPNNAILIVSGDVNPSEVYDLAKTYYGKLPFKKIPLRLRPSEPNQHAPREVVLRDPRVLQPSWSRRWLAPSYNSPNKNHAYALEVFAEVMGGGNTSRLNTSLVISQKLAVSAGAWYASDALDTSTFVVWFSPRSGISMDVVSAALEKELYKVKRNGTTKEEVNRAKQRLLDSAIFARDSIEGPAQIFGVAMTTGQDVEDVENWANRISDVTPDQVDLAAQAVLKINTSTTGILLPTDNIKAK
tara:strand:+ start:263 stop:1453 length:1191 start_codon:yes stop_codon:yes gene_type:complete